MWHTSELSADHVQTRSRFTWNQTNAFVSACRAFSIISGAFLAGINMGFIGSVAGAAGGIAIAVIVEVAIRRGNR
jgi:hypothetical protein